MDRIQGAHDQTTHFLQIRSVWQIRRKQYAPCARGVPKIVPMHARVQIWPEKHRVED